MMSMTSTVGRKLRTTACTYRAFGPGSLLPLARHALLRTPGLRRGAAGAASAMSGEVPIKQRFTGIFEDGYWNTTGSASGHGSTLASTAPYRGQLVEYLRESGARSMLDLPCGDFTWMPAVLREVPLDYIGGDIVDELVRQNRARFPDLDFRVLDITSDPLPAADVLHCRDCLFHLSYEDMARAFQRIVESDIRQVLLTSFVFREKGLNSDIVSGRFRFLDLTDAPIGFPSPARWLLDFRPWIDFPKSVGVWDREDILEPMESFIRTVRGRPARP